MATTAYVCAEEAGGCGVVWTPTSGNRRPIRDPREWAWCPDCIKAGAGQKGAA